MTATAKGPVSWSLIRDEEGHRTYTVVHKIRTTDLNDGPQVVMNASGLPAIGDVWNFGNDSDSWAFCYPDLKITMGVDKEKHVYWEAEQKFSTRPLKRCQTTSIENPTLEPDKVSGGFSKYTAEAEFDRFGNRIVNSAFEPITGPKVEFDHNRPTVKIEQNVSSLGLSTFAAMIDTLNDATLWGLAARKIKLSNVSWQKKWYGICTVYYTRTFEFDIRYDGWDKTLLDEGTKALNGEWDYTTGSWVVKDVAPGVAANPNNPQHFVRVKDRKGENMRVILDGSGEPVDDIASAGSVDVEYYGESNFTLLGLPVSL